MEHPPLSPAGSQSGRSVRMAAAWRGVMPVLLLPFLMLPGTGRAAEPAGPAVLPGVAGAIPGNPAVDMPTGDEPELAGPTLPAASPAPEAAGHQTATTVSNRHLGSLIDRDVVAPDGSHVGQAIDVLVDQDGHPAAVVVDVGGFLGVGNRRIAIAWDQFNLAGMTEKSPVTLRIGAAEVRSAPAYDASSMDVTVVHGAPVPPPAPAPPPPEADAPPVPVEMPPPPPPAVVPQPAPALPDSSSRGGASPDTRPPAPRSGQMVR
ncbi:PRC-barrel domain-containing protein [Gluconacetobacter tumulisoli]|uniref:PRC-barrel domain-containing protein n=1 Tax=Gluconacetobacter tumulisoli TaxID=1286189 RepID=A0A7W4PJN9_9PROT|nr:PRC-barrel domain-containing protein [Gluconacetobacter tumulisoli]MBB2199988.1 PRC-barrel domain-containing protein [Gluconacetobacter tumulisoli]